MKRADMRDKIVSALAGTSPMHPLRDSELTNLVGIGMRFLAPALVELHGEGHVANRDVWPPGELPYKVYYLARQDDISPYRPRDKGRDERVVAGLRPAHTQDAGKDACATACAKKSAYESRIPRLATTQRNCLCCGKPFSSQGPHNRLYASCRLKSAGPYDLY